MYALREYAVTLTSTASHLDAFEDLLDLLPEAVLLGSTETGCAALVFTVAATSPAEALSLAAPMLGTVVPDGASLSVLEHVEVAA